MAFLDANFLCSGTRALVLFVKMRGGMWSQLAPSNPRCSTLLVGVTTNQIAFVPGINRRHIASVFLACCSF